MKNYFIIFIISQFNYLIMLAQARPYIPPVGPIYNSIQLVNLNFQEIDGVFPAVTFQNGFKYKNNYHYQINVITNSEDELMVEIDNASQNINDHYYIRYKNNGYIGPIFQNNFNENKVIISGIFPSEFVIEYITSSKNLSSKPKITRISKNPNYIFKEKKKFIKPLNIHRENPTILITGFWPPTNEMIRDFSQNLDLNPEGWIGENWEGKGYDIVSYFPEFNDPNCNNCGIGYGDLMVDYQNTSTDFWNIVSNVQPIAIITFSRGNIDFSWELEYNYYNRTNWYGDYESPIYPTPNPPDQSVNNYYIRNSNLPLEIIKDAINNSQLGLNSWIDWQGNPGQFVSEFMGYHGVWYRDEDIFSENTCIFSGHIHVGGLIDWDTAKLATHITLRELINYLNQLDYISGDVNEDEFINIQDLLMILQFILSNQEPSLGQFLASDLNSDDTINIQDIILMINIILGN